jgi:hypothetical protein
MAWRWPAEGAIAKCKGNICRWFRLIAFILLVSYGLTQMRAKQNMTRRGGYDFKSGGGF